MNPVQIQATEWVDGREQYEIATGNLKGTQLGSIEPKRIECGLLYVVRINDVEVYSSTFLDGAHARLLSEAYMFVAEFNQ